MHRPELTLVLIGFGNVARRFVTLLGETADRLDFTWKIAGKLPKGFRLGKTGLLFGTPTKAGVYRATVTVVDSLGISAKKSLTLVVK